LSPELKFFDICKVCGWQDDPTQNDDPDYDGGANYISLNVAKQAFAEGQPLEPLIRLYKRLSSVGSNAERQKRLYRKMN
jgi:hypothetical protein